MRINYKKKYQEEESVYVADWLVTQIDLSKMKVKKGIELGGLWLKKSESGKKERVKKIKTKINKGWVIEFNYDSNISFTDESEAFEVYKGSDFGVWYKPAGMLADGSPYADKGSLSYLIRSKSKKTYLIQRLDREVSGLMLVAYSKKMAAFFSKELQDGKILKYYQGQVIGLIEEDGAIEDFLDGKSAHTIYQVEKVENGTSFLNIEIKTGRYHQIRRHLNMIDHPLLGDPKYGEGNKNKDGLKLVSHKCEIFDPKQRKRVLIELPKEKKLFS